MYQVWLDRYNARALDPVVWQLECVCTTKHYNPDGITFRRVANPVTTIQRWAVRPPVRYALTSKGGAA